MNEEPSEIIDRRSITSADNGALGGKPGTTHDAEALAETVADAILSGKRSPLTLSGTSTPISEKDKRTLSRMAGIPAEEFLSQVSAKLQKVAHLAADRITEKLENDDAKLSDLNMTLAISIDKLQAMSGRTSTIGSVNIQINSFQASDRSQVLGNLKTLRGDKLAPDAIPI